MESTPHKCILLIHQFICSFIDFIWKWLKKIEVTLKFVVGNKKSSFPFGTENKIGKHVLTVIYVYDHILRFTFYKIKTNDAWLILSRFPVQTGMFGIISQSRVHMYAGHCAWHADFSYTQALAPKSSIYEPNWLTHLIEKISWWQKTLDTNK